MSIIIGTRNKIVHDYLEVVLEFNETILEKILLDYAQNDLFILQHAENTFVHY